MSCKEENDSSDDDSKDGSKEKTYTYTKNSGGNQSLPGSPYGYEMWTAGGSNNKLIWYGPDQRGGAAFRAEWTNPNDFLGRVGLFWGSGGKYASYGNIYCDFEFTRSGRNTAGDYSYIGIYGWSKSPLIEYYIVEDWFGNQWQPDTTPVGENTILFNIPQAERKNYIIDTFNVDDSNYIVYKSTRTNAPSISGNATFTQYFSVRQKPRQSGTISITEHFRKWEELGLNLGNMYECKFLVEAGGGKGWFEASYLTFRQEY